MELHRIGEGQLRISLSADDMDYYQLNSETMDYDDTATRSAFWRILDRAKKQTGFDAARDRVLIQVFPRKSGGCEMYVTKAAPNKQEEQNPIKNDRALPGSTAHVTGEEQAKNTTPGMAQTTNTTDTAKHQTAQRTAMLVQCTYAFDDPESLLLCCALLCGTYHGKSEAWYEPLSDGGERYYLILWENTNNRDTWPGTAVCLSEFAGRCNQVCMPYIREHAHRIAACHAVEKLAVLH